MVLFFIPHCCWPTQGQDFWCASPYRKVQAIRPQSSTVTSIALHPTPELVMTSSQDGLIQIFNLDDAMALVHSIQTPTVIRQMKVSERGTSAISYKTFFLLMLLSFRKACHDITNRSDASALPSLNHKLLCIYVLEA